MHQEHYNSNQGSTLCDMNKYLTEMMLKGTSSELSNNDRPNWGYPDDSFEEIYVWINGFMKIVIEKKKKNV